MARIITNTILGVPYCGYSIMGPKTPILIIRAPIVGKKHSHPQEDGKAKDAKPKAVSRRSVSFGGLFSEGRSWFKGFGLRVEWGFWSLGCAMFRVGLELNLQFIRLVAAEAGLQQVLIFKPFVLLAMGPLGNMRIACCRLFPFRIELCRCVGP